MRETDPRVELVWRELADVIDPELGLDIVTLGLVYGVAIENDVAVVTHTLTTRGCPMEALITDRIHVAVRNVERIRDARTRLVWDPAWHSGMIAPGAW